MLDDLLRLSDAELDRLADALGRGALPADAGAIPAARAGLGEHAGWLLDWLAEAQATFGSREGMVAAIRLVREARRRMSAVAPPELILTGPGVTDTPIRDTSVVIRELLAAARRSVLIVGYAFHDAHRIFEPLAERMGRDPELRVRIVVNIHRRGAPSSSGELVERFARHFWRTNWPFHPRPEVYYLCEGEPGGDVALPRIHAKLVVVDARAAYVGSANFTTAAFRHNLEAGVRIRDESVTRQLSTYFDRLISSGGLGALPE
jgi:hypothetical protein